MKNKFLLLLLPSVLFVTAFRLPLLDFLATLQEKYQQYTKTFPQEKVYAHVDKMYYKPSETIWFKAYIVEGNSHKPSYSSSVVYAELIDTKGNVMEKQTLHISDGTASSGFALADVAGGIYTLRFYTQWTKNFGDKGIFEKTIQVQKIVMPNFLLTLNFPKKAHSAGETAIADLEARDLDNLPIIHTDIDFTVMLDGKAHFQGKTTTDKAGKAKVSFTLPTDLKTEDGLLNAQIQYLGKSESISRSIPITLNNINVHFFPEGGDLVAGASGKVAFQALNKAGKPADISGDLLDSQGNVLTSFKSLHQGMGSFEFLPQKNEAYKVKITLPVGIAQTFTLPAVQAEGYTIAIEANTKESLQVRFHAPTENDVYLIAQSAGKIHYKQKIKARIGKNTLAIPVQEMPIGVVRLTLFDQQEMPRAERIAFVNAHKTMKIKAKTDKHKYSPREKVEVDILTTDEAGKPVSANLSMAVIDDKIWTMADDKQDNICSYLLMSNELVGKIEEPNFYFKKDEPLATVALEHLMLTRGWRRFAWKDILGEMPTFQYLPEKNDMLAGKIFSQSTKKPVVAGVTLVEVTGLKRAIKIKTDQEGNFVFTGFDPSQTLKLIIEDKHRKQDLQVSLDNGWKPVDISKQSYDAELYSSRSRSHDITDIAVVNGVAQAKPIQTQTVQTQIIRTTTDELSLSSSGELSEEVVVVGYSISEKSSGLASSAAGIRIRGMSTIQNERLSTLDILQKMANNDGILYDYAQIPNQMRYNGYLSVYSHSYNPNKRYYKESHLAPLQSYRLDKVPYTPVRQYTPIAYTPKERNPAQRTDFRSTLFWQPEIYTDAKGEAKVSFYNSDDLTTFRIVLEGIGANGLVGREESTFAVQRPIQVETKLPAHLAVEDTTRLAVYIKNNLPTPTKGKLFVNTSMYLKKRISNAEGQEVTLAPESGETFYIDLIALSPTSKAIVQVHFVSEEAEMEDQANYPIEIRAKGFPTTVGLSSNVMKKSFEFDYNKALEGTTQTKITFFPNILEEMMAGIEGIIREPYGCFEQVTSTAYPNIMALQYIRETGKANKEIEDRALEYTEKAYKKLVGYEVNGGGFDWFGRGPAHIGLTALGIMEFTDMIEVYPKVDKKMIERTCEWLLKQKTGKGDLTNSSPTQNAYVVFALSESNMAFEKYAEVYELAYQTAINSRDAYQMALLQNVALKHNRVQESTMLSTLLDAQVQKNGLGKLVAETSVVGSYGYSLQIETASLILMAELRKATPQNKLVLDLANYIASMRQYGCFGSTQGTVLALKALSKFQKYNQQITEDVKIQVRLNDYTQELVISKNQTKRAVIESLESHLKVGKNVLEVSFETNNPVPYTFDLAWNAYTPTAQPQCEVSLKTTLAKKTIKVNETVRLTTTLQNKQNKTQAMSLAMVGIPSGLTPQAWQLKELQEKGVFDYYELFGNYVVFYYKSLAPNETKTIHLDLKADIKGQYQASASSAYLYYTNEFRDWIAGETIKVE